MPKSKSRRQKTEQFLSFPQIQSYLGIKSRKTILKYIQTGKLSAYKLGGTRWRIALKDVDEFLKNHRIHAGAPAKNNSLAEVFA